MLMGFVSEKYIESYTVKTEFFSEAVEAIIAPNQVDDSLVFESESNSIGQVEIIRMEPVTLESNKTRVCANTKNPRQGSLFLSGIIQKYAKYSYYVSSECPLNEPRVKMIPYVKCCMTVESVYDKISIAPPDTTSSWCQVMNTALLRARLFISVNIMEDLPLE